MQRFIAAAHGRYQYNRIDLVKLQNLQYGVQLALKHGINEIEASTDSLCMVWYFNREKPPWEVKMMIEGLKEGDE